MASYNLIISETNGKIWLILIMFGASNDRTRFIKSEKLLNLGFCFYRTIISITGDKAFTAEKV